MSTLDIVQPADYVANDSDCDDTDGTINPAAAEIVGDSIDNNCNDLIDEVSIGDTGPAGGIVFYKDGTGYHGLEVLPEDQFLADVEVNYSPQWGCAGTGTEIPGADGTAIGNGEQNTADILAACTEAGIAAEFASNYTYGGFNDWFLPSIDELDAMFTAGLIKRGDWPGDPWYYTPQCFWSSSEESRMNAWGITNLDFPGYYTPGDHVIYSKLSSCAVWAIRAF